MWNDTGTIGLIPAGKWIKVSEGEALTFIQKSSSSTFPFKGRIDITTAPALNRNLGELWKEYVSEGFPNLLEAYEKIEEGKSIIDGKESKWIEYYSETQGFKFQGLTAGFIKNNVLYIITCTSTPTYYDTVEVYFKKMIDSIKVNNED